MLGALIPFSEAIRTTGETDVIAAALSVSRIRCRATAPSR